MELEKPITLVHDPVRGGGPKRLTLEQIQSECPDELRGPIFDGRSIIQWQRLHDFQMVSLLLLSEQLLRSCPRPDQQARIQLYVPGELPRQKLAFRQRTIVYASPHNPGAWAVAQALKASMHGQFQITDDPTAVQSKGLGRSLHPFLKSRAPVDPGATPDATHLLLFLNKDSFIGEAGILLAAELRAVRKAGGVEVVMVHEQDPEHGAVEFATFFQCTPGDLIQGGLYGPIAVALHPDHFWPVSAALVAKALGASAASTGFVFCQEHSFYTAGTTRPRPPETWREMSVGSAIRHLAQLQSERTAAAAIQPSDAVEALPLSTPAPAPMAAERRDSGMAPQALPRPLHRSALKSKGLQHDVGTRTLAQESAPAIATIAAGRAGQHQLSPGWMALSSADVTPAPPSLHQCTDAHGSKLTRSSSKADMLADVGAVPAELDEPSKVRRTESLTHRPRPHPRRARPHPIPRPRPQTRSPSLKSQVRQGKAKASRAATKERRASCLYERNLTEGHGSKEGPGRVTQRGRQLRTTTTASSHAASEPGPSQQAVPTAIKDKGLHHANRAEKEHRTDASFSSLTGDSFNTPRSHIRHVDDALPPSTADRVLQPADLTA